MRQKIGVIASVVLAFLLAGSLIENFRHQGDTDRQLAEIKAKMNAAPSPVAVPAAQGQGLGQGQATVVTLPASHADGVPTGALERQKSLDEILDVGWKLVNQREPRAAEKAVAIFSEGIKNVAPSNADLYNGLGRAYLVADQPVEAIQAWRKGLELDGKSSIMHSGMGWAYWRLKDFARAQEQWGKSIELGPHNVDAWSAMAWVYLARQDTQSAKRGFQELVAYNREKREWVLGLSMAQGRNTDLKQIEAFFPLPPLEQLSAPAGPDVASGTQASAEAK